MATNSANQYPSDKFAFEVCVDSLESCRNAGGGGATRLELCQDLSVGGLTPSHGMVISAKNIAGGVPLFVLIRPRGGSFHYSNAEIALMLEDIGHFAALGVDGVVIGALTKSNEIDVKNCKKLISAARNLPVTFHRAFDCTNDAMVSLQHVIELGCKRLLTSGCAPTCTEGASVIRDMIEVAQDKIIIMPGGGLNERNLVDVLQLTGAREFHGSAREEKAVLIPESGQYQNELQFGTHRVCSEEIVSTMFIRSKNYWFSRKSQS